jgi:hypothetical protein
MPLPRWSRTLWRVFLCLVIVVGDELNVMIEELNEALEA